MATIDYKEKYEQAMERARQFIEKPYLEDSAGIVGHIFPELKESEDERIRKAIVKMISDIDGGSPFEKYGIIKKKALAWLEKQGEQKCNEEYNITGIKSKNAEGKLGEMIMNLKSVNEVLEQKPAEWSEEDEDIWAEISDLLWEGYKQSGSKFSWDDIRNWVNPKLKSLRPKNTWKPSYEQISILEFVMDDIEKDSIRWAVLNSVLEQLKKLKGEEQV